MVKHLLLLLTVLWGLYVHLVAQGEESKTILVVGDSLSAAYGLAAHQGWVHLLSERLQRQGYEYRVVNASISGETTHGGSGQLPPLLEQYHPHIIVLELGANDGLRGLDLRQMQSNLASMIVKSQQAGAQVMLLGMRIPPNYGKAYTEQFHQIYHDLATEYQLTLVPFLLAGVANKPALMQEDNIHPIATAQEQLLNNIWPALKPLLGSTNK